MLEREDFTYAERYALLSREANALLSTWMDSHGDFIHTETITCWHLLCFLEDHHKSETWSFGYNGVYWFVGTEGSGFSGRTPFTALWSALVLILEKELRGNT